MSAPVAFAGPGYDDGLRQWVGSRLGQTAEAFGPSTAMGVIHDGKIIAGVIFNCYRAAPHGGSIQGLYCRRYTALGDQGGAWLDLRLRILAARLFAVLARDRQAQQARAPVRRAPRVCLRGHRPPRLGWGNRFLCVLDVAGRVPVAKVLPSTCRSSSSTDRGAGQGG